MMGWTGCARLARRWARRLRPNGVPAVRPRDRGVALLIVITWLAMMIALVSEFTFGTNVDAAQAANARDELRAHYMARSGINLSRLLIKIQQRFVEPVMSQAQKMLQQAMGGGSGAGGGSGSSSGSSPLGGLGISLRVTDYADLLMGFFSGSKDEAESLGGLIGLDISQAKGLGIKAGRFDAEITPEDGKIDLNCGAGIDSLNAQTKTRQLSVFRLLAGLTFSPRYDRLFSESDSKGQFFSRLDVARALLDWADIDEQMFSPEGASAAEDYHYDSQQDKYKAHDNRYDSLEEIKLVRGVSDEFLEAFGPYLTVYPSSDTTKNCRVNLGGVSNRLGAGDCAPLVMGVIRAAAIGDPAKAATADPTILDDAKLYPLATILCDRASAGGFDSLDTFMRVLAKPESAVSSEDPRYRALQGMRPITLDRAALDAVAYVGPIRTYRVVATGSAGKVKKKITTIIDTARTLENPMTQNVQAEQASGVLQYWREE
jgi:general secretion pathway protein K